MHSTFLTAIGAVTAAIWAYLVLFRGGFWRLPRPRPLADPPPRRIVAVIPARDEAALIGEAVASLLTQNLPVPLQIVVVDDHSSDGTAGAALDAARRCGAAERLTVERGRTLPAGWTGKLWAMQQGIEVAERQSPDYLLLTDADIVHRRDNLRTLVARAEAGGYDLVSLMVQLNCRSLWERLLIPAFVFFFFKIYPPRWVADLRRRTSAAAGGCMLIRPRALAAIGGLAAIKGELIDDCALARRVKQQGAVWLGAGDTAQSRREYDGWRPIWQMVARTAFAQLNYSTAALGAVLLGLVITYLSPPLLLLSSDPVAQLCGAAAWLAMSFAFLPILRAYQNPAWLALLLPLITLFYAAATLASAIDFWRGRGGYWKGRFQAPVRPPRRSG